MDIKLHLKVDSIDFDSDIQVEKELKIGEYTFNVEKITDKEIEELFLKLCHIKTDWLSYDFKFNEFKGKIEITLMFNTMELSEEDKELINLVKNECEVFIKEKAIVVPADKFPKRDVNDFTNLGSIVILREEGSIGLNYYEVEELLNEKQIPYEILKVNQSHVEQGCSGGHSEIIIFLMNTIASGATYDGLKLFLEPIKHKLGHSKIIKRKVDDINYNKLRKVLADRTHADIQDLTLLDIYKDFDKLEICCVIETDTKKFHVRSDLKYNIIEMTTETM